MKINLFILLFFILSFISETNAQKTIKGRVVSEKTKEGIPYATITCCNGKTGINADDSGIFSISTNQSDTLKFYALGYKTRSFFINQLLKNDSIFALIESPIELKALNIRPNGKKSIIIKGAKTEKSSFVTGLVAENSVQEIALYIPNDEGQDGIIKKVGFFISSWGRPDTPFRIRVYEAKNGVPNGDLLTTDVITKGNRSPLSKSKWKMTDLSKYNIPFTGEGIFISMEWLNIAQNYDFKIDNQAVKRVGQYLALTQEFEELMGKIRINNGKWTTLQKASSSPMIRAEIEVQY